MITAPPEHERGFILISALWLLILCGAIAAVLIFRARAEDTALSAAERAYRADLQRGGAIEIVIADLLFAGARSRWAVVPVNGTVLVDGAPVTVAVTSEAGRLDLNTADLAVISGALQGLGVPPQPREAFVSDLSHRRAGKRLISTPAEVDALIAKVAPVICLEDDVTINSGLRHPRDSDLSSRMARALGVVSIAHSDPPVAGTPLRIVAGSGRRLVKVVRLAGSFQTPYLASEVGIERICPS